MLFLIVEAASSGKAGHARDSQEPMVPRSGILHNVYLGPNSTQNDGPKPPKEIAQKANGTF